MSDNEKPENQNTNTGETGKDNRETERSRDNSDYRDRRSQSYRNSDTEGDDDGGRDRSDYRQGSRGRSKVYFRRKVCKFCTQNVPLDYKRPENLERFITARGKILPRRITGTCAKHQRELARQVKRARNLALLPFVKR